MEPHALISTTRNSIIDPSCVSTSSPYHPAYGLITSRDTRLTTTSHNHNLRRDGRSRDRPYQDRLCRGQDGLHNQCNTPLVRPPARLQSCPSPPTSTRKSYTGQVLRGNRFRIRYGNHEGFGSRDHPRAPNPNFGIRLTTVPSAPLRSHGDDPQENDKHSGSGHAENGSGPTKRVYGKKEILLETNETTFGH